MTGGFSGCGARHGGLFAGGRSVLDGFHGGLQDESGNTAPVLRGNITHVIPDLLDFLLLEQAEQRALPDDIDPGASPVGLGIDARPLRRDPDLADGRK